LQPDQNLTELKISNNVLRLQRFPLRRKEPLRAWDSADEFLIHELGDILDLSTKRILIFNDSFGALSLGIALIRPDVEIINICDSYTSQKSLESNRSINGLEHLKISCFDSQSNDFDDIGHIDMVVMKVPKSLAYLQYQLDILSPFLAYESTSLIAGAMAKKIHSSTLKLFEDKCGPTRTSLAKKKARLIYCQPDVSQCNSSKEGTGFLKATSIQIPQFETPINIKSYPGVFSHGKLDHGTRFLVENIDQDLIRDAQDILDLGCGTGVLGITAGLLCPHSNISFVDEFYLSTESARINARENTSEEQYKRMRFSTTYCLDGFQDQSQDLILNNPPFHDAGAKTSHIAMDMFKASHATLRKSGRLIVVANRHLGYHIQLKRLFGNCKTLLGNSKFVILEAVR
jgi:23S rRNA (guanine1835-N2)-methyltransferase